MRPTTVPFASLTTRPGPWGPVAHVGPVARSEPAGPSAPVGPCRPVVPCAPSEPAGPGRPGGPDGPLSPSASGSRRFSRPLHAPRTSTTPLGFLHSMSARALARSIITTATVIASQREDVTQGIIALYRHPSRYWQTS